jgi:hypothetical protein
MFSADPWEVALARGLTLAGAVEDVDRLECTGRGINAMGQLSVRNIGGDSDTESVCFVPKPSGVPLRLFDCL